MAKECRNSLKLALLVSCSLLVLAFSSFSVQALNIGVQTTDSAISLVCSFYHLSVFRYFFFSYIQALILEDFFVFLRAKTVAGNASQSSVQVGNYLHNYLFSFQEDSLIYLLQQTTKSIKKNLQTESLYSKLFRAVSFFLLCLNVLLIEF
jgi:hypothetical protein